MMKFIIKKNLLILFKLLYRFFQIIKLKSKYNKKLKNKNLNLQLIILLYFYCIKFKISKNYKTILILNL